MRTILFKKTIFITLMSCGLVSCMKEELPVPLKPKGEEKAASIDMKEDYSLQIYYSLKYNAIVASNKYTAWDLAFETAPEGWHIVLNGAKFRMAVYPVSKSFDQVKVADTTGVPSLIDAASGSLDSTAFGDWRMANKTYVLHRGTDETGKYLGMMKIQILSVDRLKYKIRFASIDGSNERQLEVKKNELFNYSFLSFDDGGKTVQIEPPKREWDIVFTKYTHYYSDLDMRYSVVGCLLNSYQSNAGKDTITKNFSDISISSISSVKLQNAIDAIGFEWKSYDLNSGKFSVDASKHYIIRSGEEDLWYKLRFIDFYKNGHKGNPHFEYQRL